MPATSRPHCGAAGFRSQRHPWTPAIQWWRSILSKTLVLALALRCGGLFTSILPSPKTPTNSWARWGVQVAHAQSRRCAIPAEARELATLVEMDATDPYREAHRLATGAGVNVAIIDTGVAAHPGLDEITEGADLVTEGSNGVTDDCDAHGTIVAGIIAARGDSASGGLIGVAPGAHIIAIKQTSALSSQDPQGTLDTLAEAIRRAVELDAHIINISVVSCVPTGITVDDAALRGALADAESAQVVVIAAAGNESHACEQGDQVFPAHLPTVVAVRSLAHPYQVADYSLPSPGPSMAARGDLSAALSPSGVGIAEGIVTQDGVSPFVGTSFAAPVVSGTAALMRERDPRASAEETRERLFAAADPSTGAIDPAVVLAFHTDDAASEERQDKHRAATLGQPPHAFPARTSVALWWLVCAAVMLRIFFSVRTHRPKD